MVYCETWAWEDQTFKKQVPANTNFRHFANMIWDSKEVVAEAPWYGLEQEYTLIARATKFTNHPLGWPSNGYPGGEGSYYCSTGASVHHGRFISDKHYQACVYAGVKIAGTNAENMPGQLEY